MGKLKQRGRSRAKTRGEQARRTIRGAADKAQRTEGEQERDRRRAPRGARRSGNRGRGAPRGRPRRRGEVGAQGREAENGGRQAETEARHGKRETGHDTGQRRRRNAVKRVRKLTGEGMAQKQSQNSRQRKRSRKAAPGEGRGREKKTQRGANNAQNARIRQKESWKGQKCDRAAQAECKRNYSSTAEEGKHPDNTEGAGVRGSEKRRRTERGKAPAGRTKGRGGKGHAARDRKRGIHHEAQP